VGVGVGVLGVPVGVPVGVFVGETDGVTVACGVGVVEGKGGTTLSLLLSAKEPLLKIEE